MRSIDFAKVLGGGIWWTMQWHDKSRICLLQSQLLKWRTRSAEPSHCILMFDATIDIDNNELKQANLSTIIQYANTRIPFIPFFIQSHHFIYYLPIQQSLWYPSIHLHHQPATKLSQMSFTKLFKSSLISFHDLIESYLNHVKKNLIPNYLIALYGYNY